MTEAVVRRMMNEFLFNITVLLLIILISQVQDRISI